MNLLSSQRRRLPRERLISENGWLWLESAGAGICLIIFMIGAFVLADVLVGK